MNAINIKNSSVKFESVIMGKTVSIMRVIEYDGELIGIDQTIEFDGDKYTTRILVKNECARTPAFKNVVENIVENIGDDWDDCDGLTPQQKIDAYFEDHDACEFNMCASGKIKIVVPAEYKKLFQFSEFMGSNIAGVDVAFE